MAMNLMQIHPGSLRYNIKNRVNFHVVKSKSKKLEEKCAMCFTRSSEAGFKYDGGINTINVKVDLKTVVPILIVNIRS
ncbi:hypothetical protein GOBAR_AA30026 [Gossypium barbadense]|uniref:Uncharacterized protein n=1 Tax=Gossypium barbadense TaxID=3634 RepID=A0A2P5WHV7_GOSBA|nr:hypothetical protein GOBAR_AA30026 [Gossypium barbadense]